jgi:hypothetical protein
MIAKGEAEMSTKDDERFNAIYSTVFNDGDDVANEDARFLINMVFKATGITGLNRPMYRRPSAKKET